MIKMYIVLKKKVYTKTFIPTENLLEKPPLRNFAGVITLLDQNIKNVR